MDDQATTARDPTPEELQAKEAAAAAEQERLDAEARAQEEAEERARLARHPHTRLLGIIKGLGAPTALDINGRLGAVHRAVAELTQVILEHTPPPDQGRGNAEQGDGKGK